MSAELAAAIFLGLVNVAREVTLFLDAKAHREGRKLTRRTDQSSETPAHGQPDDKTFDWPGRR